jgi:hypothetical protein
MSVCLLPHGKRAGVEVYRAFLEQGIKVEQGIYQYNSVIYGIPMREVEDRIVFNDRGR